MPPRSSQRRTSDKRKITGLNLDTLKREGGPAEPYVTVLGGRPLTINDPLQVEWQEMTGIDPRNAIASLRVLMSDEDFEHFKSTPMPGWMLVALLRDVEAYYGVTPQDQGNGPASPTS